jgi:glycerophosphoryl diester phosphodiesterase
MLRSQTNNSLRGAINRFTVAFFVLSALAATSALAEEAAPFHIQAHRGAGEAFPENTLESFEWSWKHGVTPESDLRTTKDGTIVCFHDPNFKRVPYKLDDVLKESSVEKLSLVDVQKLDVGSFRALQFAGQHIPTLASVFAEMHGHPERLLYIDIKSVKLDQLEALVRDQKVEQQIIFTSEHPRLIRDWKKLVPESHTLLWNRGTEEQLAKKMADLRKTKFAGITHLQIHVQVGDLNSDEPFTPSSAFLRKLGKELKSHGIVFQTFSAECKDQKVLEKLLALGVESFATDYPEVTLAAVRSYRQKSQQ